MGTSETKTPPSNIHRDALYYAPRFTAPRGGGGTFTVAAAAAISIRPGTFHGVFESGAINIGRLAVNVKFAVKTGAILTAGGGRLTPRPTIKRQ